MRPLVSRIWRGSSVCGSSLRLILSVFWEIFFSLGEQPQQRIKIDKKRQSFLFFTQKSIRDRPIFVKEPTPLLNTPHFSQVFGGNDGSHLPLDDQGMLRPVELVALPGTELALHQKGKIATVQLCNYPIFPLYVDSRALSSEKLPAFTTSTKRKDLIQELLKREGAAYIWGGNWSPGIPSLLKWYPPKATLSEELKKKWSLQGVDCSGLLYEVTGGKTPRNSGELLFFGTGLPCEKKKPLELSALMQPLDLIATQGHVIIALGDGRCIESIHPHGVIISNMRERFEMLCNEKTPSNNGLSPNSFVIRRWFQT